MLHFIDGFISPIERVFTGNGGGCDLSMDSPGYILGYGCFWAALIGVPLWLLL